VRRRSWRRSASSLAANPNVHLLASNEAAARSLEELTGTVIDVAYSGFDVDEIDAVLVNGMPPHEVRQRFNIDPSAVLIVLVGQLIVRKGWSTLFGAMPEIFGAIPNASVVWLTMNEPQSEVVEEVRSAQERFDFRVMNGSDIGGRRAVLEFQRAADMFLMPSLEEGLPMALVEAMALGTACIATPVGAIPEAIEHEVSGLLADTGSPRSLAEQVTRLANDGDLRVRLGKKAREIAGRKFDNRVAGEINRRAYDRAFAAGA
jgi:glycosyltransferase involved in cell wall biosynthesis